MSRNFTDDAGQLRDIVNTQAGVVTLFGIIPSQNAKASATADAGQVRGVKRVGTDLQVVPSAKQPAVKARDDELAHAVKQAFEPPAFKDSTVAVKNGVVRLTGTVANGARRLEAATAARAMQGVRAVKDDLHLSAATPARGADHTRGLFRRGAVAKGPTASITRPGAPRPLW